MGEATKKRRVQRMGRWFQRRTAPSPQTSCICDEKSSDQRERVVGRVRQHRLVGGPAALCSAIATTLRCKKGTCRHLTGVAAKILSVGQYVTTVLPKMRPGMLSGPRSVGAGSGGFARRPGVSRSSDALVVCSITGVRSRHAIGRVCGFQARARGVRGGRSGCDGQANRASSPKSDGCIERIASILFAMVIQFQRWRFVRIYRW